MLMAYRAEHTPPLSKLRRHELIHYAMLDKLIKESDLTTRDLEILLNKRSPTVRTRAPKKTAPAPVPAPVPAPAPAPVPQPTEPLDDFIINTSTSYYKNVLLPTMRPPTSDKEAFIVSFLKKMKEQYGITPDKASRAIEDAHKSRLSGKRLSRTKINMSRDILETYRRLYHNLEQDFGPTKTQEEIKKFNREASKILKKIKELEGDRQAGEYYLSNGINDFLKKNDTQEPKPQQTQQIGKVASRLLFDEPPKAVAAPVNTSPPPPRDWREKLQYFDERRLPLASRRHLNIITHLDPNIDKERGFEWLNDKYGKIYQTAVAKLQQIADGTVPSIDKMTPKQYKEFSKLPFNNAKEMNQFFIDVFFADQPVYHYLQYNSTRKKAPSYISAYRDFSEWNDYNKPKPFKGSGASSSRPVIPSYQIVKSSFDLYDEAITAVNKLKTTDAEMPLTVAKKREIIAELMASHGRIRAAVRHQLGDPHPPIAEMLSTVIRQSNQNIRNILRGYGITYPIPPPMLITNPDGSHSVAGTGRRRCRF